MQTALLAVQPPPALFASPGAGRAWAALVARVRGAAPGVEEIAPGVWQIPVGGGTRPLAAACAAVDAAGPGWGYRLLFLPERPTWLAVPPRTR